MKPQVATGLACILMASCSKTPLPWKPSIETLKDAEWCIVNETHAGSCSKGDAFTVRMIHLNCVELEDFKRNIYNCDKHNGWLSSFSSDVEAAIKRKAEDSRKSSTDPIEACRRKAHLAAKSAGASTYQRAKGKTTNQAKLVFVNQGITWETHYFCD